MRFVLLDIFKLVEDPRDSYGREYRLEHILFFSVLAILSKMENYKDIALFIETHFEKLKSYFGLKWRRPPTHSAIWKILTAIDPLDIEAAFRTYSERINGPLSKPSKSEFWEGDTEHRSGAYLDVREHSSCTGFQAKSQTLLGLRLMILRTLRDWVTHLKKL
jgi:hypothetical protein